jgi:hypothetical protein
MTIKALMIMMKKQLIAKLTKEKERKEIASKHLMKMIAQSLPHHYTSPD